MPLNLERVRDWAFAFAVVWGGCIFWLAHHPPMVDLPQHAGQVALLLDMAKGDSPWSDLVHLNLATPYLIGYGLALPLSYFMPISFALKILLTLSYWAFIVMAVRLRRHFGADKRLDWFFILSFFGMAGYWGFLTFLVAVPICFLFVYICERYAFEPTRAGGLRVFAVGLVLLVSHGLAFCFGWAIGFALVVRSKRSLALTAWAVAPLLALLPPLAAYALASRHIKLEMVGLAAPAAIHWDYTWQRFSNIFMLSVGNTQERWVAVSALVFLLAPWLMGLRIALDRPARCVPFVVTMLVMLLVPETALDTAALYTRFALFIWPTYALMFSRPAPTKGAAASSKAAFTAEAALLMTCFYVLALHSWRTIGFDREEADFRVVLESMEPRQRALSLVFDTASKVTHHDDPYIHMPVWYQAEKHGLVDFNFAWFPPQLMRFRPGHVPAFRPGDEWRPAWFDWKRDNGDIYRYFVVRQGGNMPLDLFKGAPCKPVQIAVSGRWSVYEHKPCR